MIELPPELLARHGGAAPRYTSYPTVMHWGAAPAAGEWLAALDRTLSAHDARAGLYVHIPFCASQCSFCGCNMRVARSHAMAAPYIDRLLQESGLYRHGLGANRLALNALHLGGGSPTWLPVGELDRLLDGLLADTTIDPDADFAIEADPRNTTREQLAVLRRHGFSRIVIGVQDLDARVLEIVNRTQGETEVRRLFDAARDAGFTGIGADFIYGLPLQTTESLCHGLERLLRLAPERVNLLPYAHVPWIKPSQRQYTEADLPDAALRQQLFLAGRELLGAAGYVEIGFDQYAVAADPLAGALAAGRLTRSFMGFSALRSDALIGLGVSAIGEAANAHAQNEKNLQQYEARLAAGELPLQRGHVLSEEDRQIRAMLWALFAGASAGIDAAVRRAPWWTPVRSALEPLARDGLVELSEQAIRVTATGRTFLRRIGLAFDRHHAQALAA